MIPSVAAGGAIVFQSVAAKVPAQQVWQPRAVLPWWQPGAVLRSMAAEEAALQRRQPRAALQLWQPRGCKLRCAEKRINRWDVDEFSHGWIVGGADWEVIIFLIPHLSWGGPNWKFWAHTPIIKLTYFSHLTIFALGRSKL